MLIEILIRFAERIFVYQGFKNLLFTYCSCELWRILSQRFFIGYWILHGAEFLFWPFFYFIELIQIKRSQFATFLYVPRNGLEPFYDSWGLHNFKSYFFESII